MDSVLEQEWERNVECCQIYVHYLSSLDLWLVMRGLQCAYPNQKWSRDQCSRTWTGSTLVKFPHFNRMVFSDLCGLDIERIFIFCLTVKGILPWLAIRVAPACDLLVMVFLLGENANKRRSICIKVMDLSRRANPVSRILKHSTVWCMPHTTVGWCRIHKTGFGSSVPDPCHI